MANKNYDAFVEAYNNFDSRPLEGESMKKFYVDDFTRDITNSIIKTVQITEKFRKILIIGHTGCGKSTILNKVAEELEDKYHVVTFSVALYCEKRQGDSVIPGGLFNFERPHRAAPTVRGRHSQW